MHNFYKKKYNMPLFQQLLLQFSTYRRTHGHRQHSRNSIPAFQMGSQWSMSLIILSTTGCVKHLIWARYGLSYWKEVRIPSVRENNTPFMRQITSNRVDCVERLLQDTRILAAVDAHDSSSGNSSLHTTFYSLSGTETTRAHVAKLLLAGADPNAQD